jgi:hypothetical protein
MLLPLIYQWNKVFHRYIGRLIVPLGLVNVLFGLTIISPLDTTLQISVQVLYLHLFYSRRRTLVVLEFDSLTDSWVCVSSTVVVLSSTHAACSC